MAQARADADGELDDESLASIIAHAIGMALGWHQESPEHTRNATTSSRTWRPAGGPRGGRPQEFEERSFEDRGPRQFDDRRRGPPPDRGPSQDRGPYQDRGGFQPRPPYQDRPPRDFDDRNGPPRRGPRDDDRDFPPRRGPQAARPGLVRARAAAVAHPAGAAASARAVHHLGVASFLGLRDGVSQGRLARRDGGVPVSTAATASTTTPSTSLGPNASAEQSELADLARRLRRSRSLPCQVLNAARSSIAPSRAIFTSTIWP